MTENPRSGPLYPPPAVLYRQRGQENALTFVLNIANIQGVGMPRTEVILFKEDDKSVPLVDWLRSVRRRNLSAKNPTR